MIEIVSARLRTRRSRVRCSASTSTRQLLSDPRLSSEILPEIFSGSDTITHLHIFFCERGPPCGLAEQSHRKIFGPDFWGVVLNFQETGAAPAGRWGCPRPPGLGPKGWHKVPLA